METGLFLACYISLVNVRVAFSPTVSGMECYVIGLEVETGMSFMGRISLSSAYLGADK
jgi:hypothetical protein